MKIVLLGMALLMIMAGMIGCFGSTPESQPAPPDEIIEIVGTVHYINLEGGFWGIRGDDGKNYDPINLSPELQKEGLRAEFKFKIKKDVAGIHMWGRIVEILEYKVIE